MSALADYGIHSQSGIEGLPALRMVGNILATVDAFFSDSGCPLTPAQRQALEAAQIELANQERAA